MCRNVWMSGNRLKKSTIVMRSLTPIDDSMKSMAELCLGKSQFEKKHWDSHSLTIISQKHSACTHTLVFLLFVFFVLLDCW